jgi:hypothetical protein
MVGAESIKYKVFYRISMSFAILCIMVGCSILSTQEYHSSTHKDIPGTTALIKKSFHEVPEYNVHAEYPHGHPIIDEYNT